MSKYHVNPETGNPGKCSAQEGRCPFGSDALHYASEDDARKAYEGHQKYVLQTALKKPRPKFVVEDKVDFGGRYTSVGLDGVELGTVSVKDGMYLAGTKTELNGRSPRTLGTFAFKDEAVAAVVKAHGHTAPMSPRVLASHFEAKHPGAEVSLHEGSNGYVILHGMKIPKEQQRAGVGTAIMEELVAKADQEGWPLALSPSADWGASSTARLERFYGRFGFVKNKGKNKDFTIMESMIRPTTREA